MDRIALAKRLESLSSVFASHTPYNRDLKAMSYVLNKMADDKFTGILSGDFGSEDTDACMCGKGPGPLPGIIPVGGPVGEPMDLPGADGKSKIIIIKKEGEMPMSVEASEKTAGMFWCKQASKAVVDNLLRDVVGMNKSVCCDTGRHLDKEQIPDGTHKPTLAPTLKKEQAPDIEKSINSGMVEKSHGAVQKEASIEDIKKRKEEKAKAQTTKDVEDLKKAQKAKKSEKKASDDADEKVEQIAEKKEEEAEKLVEEAQSNLDKAKEKLEEARKEEDKAEKEEKDATSSSVIDGIELMASMDEVELDAGEAAKLSRLFS